MRALARVVLDELQPRYAGLLPEPVVRDRFNARSRTGSASTLIDPAQVMANRLVTVRLDQHLIGTDDLPPDQPDTDRSDERGPAANLAASRLLWFGVLEEGGA